MKNKPPKKVKKKKNAKKETSSTEKLLNDKLEGLSVDDLETPLGGFTIKS